MLRTTHLDGDYRRQPKTTRYCVRCQRDLKPGQPARLVHLLQQEPQVLHPADTHPNPAMSLGWWLVGLDCAKQIGLEFTLPEDADLP